jgi:hypothetical protein
MGQWVVSVLGLEPLHLGATPTPRVRWRQGYLTSSLEQRRGVRSTAGRRQVHEKAVSSRRDVVSSPAAWHAAVTWPSGRGRAGTDGSPEHSPGGRACRACAGFLAACMARRHVPVMRKPRPPAVMPTSGTGHRALGTGCVRGHEKVPVSAESAIRSLRSATLRGDRWLGHRARSADLP